MTADRRSLSINHNEAVQQMMDDIARYIRSLTPTDPLFPPPLSPVRVGDGESDEYNPTELAGSCARLLAQHINDGRVSDETLKRLYQETEKLTKSGIKLLTGQVRPRYIDDLTSIAEYAVNTLSVKISIVKGSLNLKAPLMMAILYAHEYVRGRNSLKTDLDPQ